MANTIKLSSAELLNARNAGEGRSKENSKGKNIPKNMRSASVARNIQGAKAELAVAKYFGLPWTGRLFTVAGFKSYLSQDGHDVGPLEVKSTVIANGPMRLPTDTPDEAPHVLVYPLSNNTFEMVGWCLGKEGKQAKYLSRPQGLEEPCYYVPKEALKPIGELEAALKSHMY